MTQTLNDLLRRGADSVAAPRLDLSELVAEAGRRRRRRRSVVIATAAGVSAIVVGSVLIVQTGSMTDGTSPANSPSPSASIAVDSSVRTLVYAEGRTVHVGEKTVVADKPVAFIAPTDDGAVYEAALDGTLWFTDGTTTQMIGTSGFTAAPTSHPGVVSTGSSGSLVVWADVVRQNRLPVEFVVYDTSRREEVARIPFPERGRAAIVDYVGEDEVWYASDGGTDPSVYRFDVRTGATTPHPRSDLDAVLKDQPRSFAAVARNGHMVYGEPFFTEEGGRLVAGIHTSVLGEVAAPVTLADGSELRLQLPRGYVGPWPADEEPALAVSQWLDDDQIVLWADDGGGDLPAKRGDFLVCRLPDGVCHVTVSRASRPYVAPDPSGPSG